jgi:hypothetical protein
LRNSKHVLNGFDRTIHTVAFVLYEEAMNLYHGVAFYGGKFFLNEVSVWAMGHESVAPFLVPTIMDLARHWRLTPKGPSPFFSKNTPISAILSSKSANEFFFIFLHFQL